MSWIRRILIALAVVTTSVVAAPDALHARTKASVVWTQVDGPKGAKDSKRLARTLRQLLKQASRKADFGKSGKFQLRARITEYVVEKKKDVLRIRCTVIGRLEGGPSAKSRISYGGDPKDPKGLEKQVLTLVARGVTSRLAAIAKSRPAPKKKRRAKSSRHLSTTDGN